MAELHTRKKRSLRTVTFGAGTVFNGFLKFKERLCIRGTFTGTIEAVDTGVLTVEKNAAVEADHISVTALTVYGTVTAPVEATGKIDMFPGAQVRGDIVASRLRIAPGALFDGQCRMITTEREIDIFGRPAEEIKTELQGGHDSSDTLD